MNAKKGFINILFYLFLIFFIILPLLSFILTSFYKLPISIFDFSNLKNIIGTFSFSNYNLFFSNSYYVKALEDSLLLGIAVTTVSLIISLPVSYGLSRTTMKAKQAIRSLLMMGIGIPGFILTYDFIILSTNFRHLPFNIYSFEGLLIVMSLTSVPFMVMYGTLALGNLDQRLIESARANGVSEIKIFFNIILPLIFPGFAAGMIIVFLLATGSLSIPLLLAPTNFPIITALAYTQLFSFFRWGLASAMLVLLLLVNMVAIIIYMAAIRRSSSTITGKGFRIKYNDNRAVVIVLTIYSAAIAILPIIEIAILGLSAFSYRWIGTITPTSYTTRNFGNALAIYPFSIWSTIITCLFAGFIAVAISLISTYGTRTGTIYGRKVIDFMAMLIFALSNVMVGISYLALYSNRVTGVIVSDLPVAMIMGYVFARLGYSIRSVGISLDSVSNSLFEAGKIMLKSRFSNLLYIILPLALPGIIEGFLLVFVRSSIDYASTILLAPLNWSTLALASFSFISTGELALGAALAFIIILITLPISSYLYVIRGRSFREVV
jgi:iron(III) transport system permease protein